MTYISRWKGKQLSGDRKPQEIDADDNLETGKTPDLPCDSHGRRRWLDVEVTFVNEKRLMMYGPDLAAGEHRS